MKRNSPEHKASQLRLKVGIIGFGLSGQVFHAPFLQADTRFDLHSIVTSGTVAGQKYPSVRVLSSIDELLQIPDIDLVIVCSPNEFHFKHTQKALLAGKHVVVEKPFTVNSAKAQELIHLSENTGKRIFPYHNRRWDSDFLTLQKVLKKELLGKVLDFESHIDRYAPDISRAAWRYDKTEGGGTLFDLGIHLIDQALLLFGKPEAVFARLFNQRASSVTDDSFELKLIYPGIWVTLKAGVFVREAGPRFSVHGTTGSFVKSGIDVQESQLRAGMLPAQPGFGIEPLTSRAILHTSVNGKIIRKKLKSEPGCYQRFYNNVYDVLTGTSTQLVKPEEALLNIRIIEAARKSAEKESVIKFD